MALKLQDYFNETGQPVNDISPKIDKDKLAKIGQTVLTETKIDLDSMEEWLSLTEKAMDIAKQVIQHKSFPWDGAANVKYPLITGAAIQFAARAYSEIIKGDSVAKGQVVGADPEGVKADRAKRVSRHLSYQLLNQMPEWEPQVDQMLHMIPVIGTAFKHTYYCPLKERNVSELLPAGPDGLILHNKNVKDLTTARRLTHCFTLYTNDIYERINSGVFNPDLEIEKLTPADASGDDQAPHAMYAQHRWIDLDDDGYEEPYIVTIHKDTGIVCRVMPRFTIEDVKMDDDGKKVLKIDAASYFTKFGFFPDPAGGFLDMGFGHILYPINESINTTLNQLLDAGTLANVQGGFVAKGFRIKAGTFSLGLGEWKQIDVPSGDLKSSLMPLPAKGPSNVLFQLLGFLVEAGKGLASQTEVLQGEQPAANVPATTVLALIEQGLKVYNSIYKRFYRSLKDEFRKLAKLNSTYLDDEEYYNVLDERLAVARNDYNTRDLDILPVADPTASTEVQRMARAQALMQIRQDPLANGEYILSQYVDAIGEDPTKALLAQDQRQQAPDLKMLEFEEKVDYNKAKLHLEEMLAKSQIDLNNTTALVNMAKAEATELGSQFNQYMQQFQSLHEQNQMLYEGIQGAIKALPTPQQAQAPETEIEDDESGILGMEAAPDNEGLLPVSEGAASITGKVLDPSSDGRLNATTDGL